MVPDKKPITILIIDDDEIVCYMAKTILEDNLRCEVLTAFSGMDGIDMMIENTVHLVLLDVAMSGWSGFKTLSVIRDKVLLRDIPVIMLTSAADRGSVIKALKLGVADYIRKPFLPEELVARVSKVIREYWQEESIVVWSQSIDYYFNTFCGSENHPCEIAGKQNLG